MIIERTDPNHPDARKMLRLLSDALAKITGDSGNSSFNPDDAKGDNASFVVARIGQECVGCGAIRPFSSDTAELKRMFALKGAGSRILVYLEKEAQRLGYQRIVLSTRVINGRAVSFYERHHYRVIPNFGRYKGRPESICMEKRI